MISLFFHISAFGFCEFANPDAALRAIRLLHDYEIASKKLVVKADSKTNEVLEEHKGKPFIKLIFLNSIYF